MNENTSVTAYLKSIAKMPPLSRAEEIRISTEMVKDRKKIVNSLKIKTNLSRLLDLIPDLEEEEREEVMALIQKPTPANIKLLKQQLISFDFGILSAFCKEDHKLQPILDRVKANRDRMVNGNLRLVISIAKSYTNSGLPFLDLIQNGNIGLLRAVDKFQPERGLKFSTHATWWVKQAMTRSLANSSRTIRVPVHMVDSLMRAYKKLQAKFDRIPTPEEMAAEIKHPNVPQIKEIMDVMGGVVSLSSKPDQDFEDTTYETFLRDPGESAETRLVNLDYKRAILEVLDKMTIREQKIFRLKNGI